MDLIEWAEREELDALCGFDEVFPGAVVRGLLVWIENKKRWGLLNSSVIK